MYTNLPKACLAGIVLTISTHSGPQVVYHYPPVKQPVEARRGHKVDSRNERVRSWQAGRMPSAASGAVEAVGEGADGLEEESSESEMDRSSGLSESEVSTDWADYSMSSSESESELREEGGGDGSAAGGGSSAAEGGESLAEGADSSIAWPGPSESYNQLLDSQSMVGSSANVAAAVSTKPKSIKSRHSQISANKLFQYLTNTSDAESRRQSVFSKVTGNEDGETIRLTDSVNLLDLESLLEELEPGLTDVDISELLDVEVFQPGRFQDVSKIFNFDAEFVAELCCPPKEMCNTRFELTVDDLCFLGLPIHVDETGRWRKQKVKRQQTNTRSKRSSSGGKPDAGSRISVGPPHSTQERQPSTDQSGSGAPNLAQGGIDNGHLPDPEHSDDLEDLQKAVQMFHVCFIMNPQLVEYNERIDDMYHYVVTRLSLILRYIQDKKGYVVKECAKILKTRDRILKKSLKLKKSHGQALQGRYLYECILKSSSLARALTKCFNSIINNEIVTLDIDNHKMISLQIPIKNEFSSLPDLKINPVLRGSYLTSILNDSFLKQPVDFAAGSMMPDGDSMHDDNDVLDYALLLLDDTPKIIKDLEFSSFGTDLANVIMINLVKNLKPTVSLRSYLPLVSNLLEANLSLSARAAGTRPAASTAADSHSTPLQHNMIRSIVLHLVYWRYARIILPLSSKNTYIVSPLAPIRGTAADDFENTDMVKQGCKALIYQNQDLFHEKFPTLPTLPSFLSSISTCKPRSFGHLIPSKDHKLLYLSVLAWLIRYGYLTQLLTFAWIRVDRRIKIAVDEDLEREGVRTWNSIVKKEHHQNPHDNVAALTREHASSTTEGTTSPSEHGDANMSDGQESLDDYLFKESDYTIILEPKTATALEKRWLFKCIENQPTEMQLLFRKVIKYFNGKTPLELVEIKENIPKQELKKLIMCLDKYVVELKHW
ncbi:AaceriAGL039Wp [[Ashbya] aceris (nom. inval.)]|nr:AaceriAGL039Wp [[Ashbya] aceris (nom. inval.)]